MYRLSVLVSADMGIFISVIHRYRPIRKLDLLVIIGIGQYGKIHIVRTLVLPYNHELKLLLACSFCMFKSLFGICVRETNVLHKISVKRMSYQSELKKIGLTF